MEKTLIRLAFACLLLVFAGCGDSDENEYSQPAFPGCVDYNETVGWNHYGRYRFNSVGPDSTARGLVGQCGWEVFNGHNGGYGETLEISKCTVRNCPPDEGNPSQTDVIEDYCVAAVYIDYLPFRGTGNTSAATVEDNESNLVCVTRHGHSAWYYFTADRDGYVTADTSGSDYDTVLAAFHGGCANLSDRVGCDDDSGAGSASKVVFPVQAGEAYYLMAGAYGTTAGGNLVLNVTFRECLVPNDCVVLVWAYNQFQGFRLLTGWTGVTDEGIGMGATLAEFLAVYPYFTDQGNRVYLYENGDTRVRATFNDLDRLQELLVGYYFRG